MFTGVINFNFTLPNPSLFTAEICYAAAPVALLMIAVYSISSKKNKKKKEEIIATEIVEEATVDDVRVLYKRRRSYDDEICWKSASDVLFEEDEEAIMLEADAKYAEELQVLKALQASQISTQRPSLSSFLMQVVCKICLEKHESWQMFTNSTCSHSFCYDCTAKHATTQIQSKRKTIACPGINCNSTLDSNMLRLIIPQETLIKWDEFLCESLIPESQKLYCPFTNCSVLLINDDTSNGVTKINCPVCRRSFCKVCRVPWHSELSCKEFGKLKGKTDDEMAVALAKKKKWKKCPNCNFFVEKAEGCVHITCRCKFEFCYTCGAKWSQSHNGCRRQNGVNIGN
ncbi:putative transcription factor C2H2 family [Helianthus annuus]|uniref:RBR-type E3 ubiquitin transferase n=1 Tax=Helianthus annuus TaxID=4232 RepID=A0A9K3NBL4_HELAN|nr:probable E3 ubiquitin-protein ligase RNF217 [Helianthus annuus]KAF5794286.1 putative transcription factor C2H2 family [Helianthus annuus]KAJ0545695.1 putative transcription factor C2H2 family [Helianthus annuus]KAJ0552566.1 putative transcription factor C2H2 family [Helianthus annuus]KAJ0721499.1 putative transcription factor C2H2 family [Helianthus annuus]KAJ0896698.1 putative transcription factor C2H2 family [Helianthus annuus]